MPQLRVRLTTVDLARQIMRNKKGMYKIYQRRGVMTDEYCAKQHTEEFLEH